MQFKTPYKIFQLFHLHSSYLEICLRGLAKANIHEFDSIDSDLEWVTLWFILNSFFSLSLVASSIRDAILPACPLAKLVRCVGEPLFMASNHDKSKSQGPPLDIAST